MQIVCATALAGAQVLTILFAAQLQVLRHFTIQPVLIITPPLIFTMLVALTIAQVTKIGAVPDTTIAG
jgi:hypothetical protein